MKKILIALAATAAALSVGCQKTEIAGPAVGSDSRTITLRATIDDETRTTLDESGSSQASVKWALYDAVAVYMKQAFDNRLEFILSDPDSYGNYIVSPEFFVVRTGNGTTSAEFSSEISEYITPLATDTYYGVYPYNMVSTSAWSMSQSVLKLRLSEVQKGDFAENFKDNGAMVAKAENASYKNLSLSFRNVHAILKFTLTGSATLDRIVFRGNDGEAVAGEFTVDMSAADFAAADFSKAAAKQITVSCGKSLTSEAQNFYAIVPAMEYAKGYTVEFIASDGSKITKSVGNGAPKKLVRNRVYELPAIDFNPSSGGEASCEVLWQTSDGLVSEVSLDDASGAIDLGDAANCFMVNTGGSYRFRAVKGNGGKIADELDGKYISFKASDAKGNAVIAVKVNGQTAWSWHIWCTDAVADGEAAAGHTVMDRNLGATSTTIGDAASYGLYYQWGRKDPFIGAGTTGEVVKGSAETAAFGNLTAPYVGDTRFATINNNDTAITDCVGFTIANPTTFIKYVVQVNGSGVNTWFNSDYTAHADLWGVSGAKSEYDPCPAGYRVPADSQETWKGFTKTDVEFSDFGFTANGIGYPMAGCRGTDGKIAKLGAQVYYPSSLLSGEKAMSVYAYYYKLTASASTYMSSFAANHKSASHLAQGYPVRCEKINE